MRTLLVFSCLAGCTAELPEAEPPERVSTPVSAIQNPGGDVPPHASLSGVVVTAIDTFDETGTGDVGTIYVEEPGGGPYSGISIFAPSGAADLRVGDVVDVDGDVVEFELGQIDPAWADETGRTLTQLDAARVTWTGDWVAPEPAVVPVVDFSNDVEAEKWEGVLVRLEDAQAQGPPDERSQVDLTVDLQLDDDLYRVPEVTTGTTFAGLVGVVSYLYTYKIYPRGPDDVER